MAYDDSGNDTGYNDQNPDIPFVQVPGAIFGFQANDPQLFQWQYPGGKQQSKQMVRMNPQTGQWEYQDNPDYQAESAPTPAPSTTNAGVGWSEGGLTLSAADKARVDKMLSDVQSTDDPTYWYRLVAQHGGVDSTGEGWLNDRIRRGDGSALVKNGTLTKFQDTPDSTNKSVLGGASAGDWFSANAPSPASYSQLARPDYLQGPYVPRQFTEQFTAPTMEDLKNDPGYQAGADLTQKGLERSAAAKGSILSGGFVGSVLPRALNEYAGQAYQNLFGRAYDTYQQKYNQFLNAQNADLAARGLNENTFQTDLGNNLNTYKTRQQAYQDAINNNFNLAQLGLNATTAGNPGQPL